MLTWLGLLQLLQQKCQTLGDLNNKHQFLTALEVRKSKIQEPESEHLLLGSWPAILLLCPHVADRERESPLGPFHKDMNPFLGGFTLTPESPPKGPSS